MCNSSDDVQKMAPHGVSYFGLWNLIAGDSNPIIYALFVFVKNVHSGLCNVKTGVISGGGISSSQMKIDIAFPTQTTEQGSDGGGVNAILIHALYGERLNWWHQFWRYIVHCGRFWRRRTVRVGPSKVVGDQSTSDNVFTNWSLVVVNCLSCCIRNGISSLHTCI
jgi:hypothetical protein